jgi:hypothetical protein
MFIRWQRTRHQKVLRTHEPPPGKKFASVEYYVRAAVLIRSIRTSAGPRQKHVCYLGSIHEGDEAKLLSRIRFWESVDRKIGAVDISDKERHRILAALDAVVAKPTRKEITKREAKLERHDAMLRRLGTLRSYLRYRAKWTPVPGVDDD